MSNIFSGKEALFQHRFWLQILGDHGRFIYGALSPDEQDRIETAEYFMRIFDELLEQARQDLREEQIAELTKQAYSFAEEIRGFKLSLIRDHLTGKIKIDLPPTFLNHMVNEVEEYLGILQSLMKSNMPAGHPLQYHMLWLPDAAGHASGIKCRLDDVEKDLIMRCKEFEMDFHDLHKKAEEFNGYTRANLMDFPALNRLNSQAAMKIGVFMRFLKELEELRVAKSALGTLLPLMVDHMYREECYYLLCLSRVSDVKDPNCDPATPRIRE